MIKKIHDRLNGTNLGWAIHPNFVSIFLDLIEEFGMLPPIEPYRTVGDLDLGVPEWEPEDE